MVLANNISQVFINIEVKIAYYILYLSTTIHITIIILNFHIYRNHIWY